MTIKELRILPPFAIGRLGSAEQPLDNYIVADDASQMLGFRKIVPQETLIVDEASGEISHAEIPATMEFKTDGRIRPVAPFLEVFAVTDEDQLVPLTLELLAHAGLGAEAVAWRVNVANRKVVRRTQDDDDLVAAATDWFSDHAPQPLAGHSANFIAGAAVDFGHARYIKPNRDYPGIRLRFTPAKGLIYGPKLDQKPDWLTQAQPPADDPIPPERAIYDVTKGTWCGFGGEAAAVESGSDVWVNETVPPSLYAIEPPAPSWLFNNNAVSRGYFDDACDGFVDVRLTMDDGRVLTASARVCAGPPALVPDSMFVRSLADDLDQVINGPTVDPEEPDQVTRARAADIVRRAYETVRFMNVAVMNGNDFKGRSALGLDSMPEEEAADTQRAIRPVMSPETVDTLGIMALHEQVYAALRGGAAPWFLRLLRQPDEAADFSDRGRRKMPALMCGADNNYLALTWRQIDTIRKAASASLPVGAQEVPATLGVLSPRNLTAQVNYRAAGNPVSSRPETSVANCCPGLEVDFRAVWRRMFKGIVLREHDNLVVAVDPGHDDELIGHRLLKVYPPSAPKGILMMTDMTGAASSDPDGTIRLTTNMNPHGLAALEWSNALAKVLSGHGGEPVRCDFTREKVWDEQAPWVDDASTYRTAMFEVRPFFDDDTAVIARVLADPGELTQGLCSPWQNDYRECSCYYWASARPDYVNIETTAAGLSNGDNWLQKERTGDYVPDDYADTRLILYDELFTDWERWLRFQVGGRDVPPPEPPTQATGKVTIKVTG